MIIHQVSVLRAGKDPRLSLALAEARTDGLRLDDMLDRRTYETRAASDKNDRLGRHIFRGNKGEGVEGSEKMNVAAE